MINDFLIKGEVFEDERGKLRFINLFDMSEIIRFYEIVPKNQQIIRAWQGHKHEKKWFHCLSGSFIINIIEIDNFSNPSDDLIPTRIVLSSQTPEILAIPNGFATGIMATLENSRLQVFSNFGINESKKDDFRYPLEKWQAEW
ncbi:dTDP-6-deoxy-3,4-keto-hexulose isomerase [Flagellimonas aquimarina]|uniref:dTDP-6-deoxy-3,4-keto-hexulose isomerase n=1 Tax=Flagellimonas aquimarina TaxID=2201895 RepID=A0A316KZU8_9FLAO|nr:dTDP-6-deoxy-3,4-keto-hexulose isomerase [Allomuricauda koreensis]PWL39146.1 dTDP-6-deoxy-3,4-keto-hexulose isomerase [Allomuricauda koreensis]